MAQQLRSALHDIADRTPVAGPPPDLWQQGRRRRRVARLTQVTVAAGLVTVLMAAWSAVMPGTRPIDPAAGTSGELQVPDAVHVPDGWRPSTTPSGPVAMVGFTERRDFWLRSRPAVFAVSAVDGSSRWLELPGRADSDDRLLALSPDGTRLGYLLAGEPTGRVAQSDVVGFAVYDTETGQVTRRFVPTRHGLALDHSGLTWSADSQALAMTYGQYGAAMGSSSHAHTEIWHPGTGAVTRVRLSFDHSIPVGGYGATDDAFWSWQGAAMLRIDTSTGTVTEVATDAPDVPRMMVPSAPSFSPGARRVAYIGERPMRPPGGVWPAVYAAEVAADGTVGPVALANPRWHPRAILGWLRPDTLLLHASSGGGLSGQVVAWRLDGRLEKAIDIPEGIFSFHVAADLLAQPLAEGRSWRVPAPPPLVLLAGGLVLIPAAAHRVWRRRRGPVAATREARA